MRLFHRILFGSGSSVIRLVSLILVIATASVTQAESFPLPQFYGIFALHDGKLTELKRNPQSDSYLDPITGRNEIHSVSNVIFPDSDDLSFIIFSPQVAFLNTTEIRVSILARIANLPPPAFHMTNRGWSFRIAPIPNHPQMVHLIFSGHLPGGRMALLFDGFYDFEINQPLASSEQYACVESLASARGYSYQPCTPAQSRTSPKPTPPATSVLSGSKVCKANLAGNGTLPKVVTVEGNEYYDVDVGHCRLLVAKGAYRGGKMTWSGSCNSRGYAEGQGIWRAYDASGCLVMINKASVEDGRVSGSEGIFSLEHGQIIGNHGPVAPQNLPDWARELVGSQ